MAQREFKARMADGSAAVVERHWRPWPMIWGAAASATVLGAFYNLQAISDMAPESIRNSDMPGAFGAPVAVVTMLWIVAIPVWFLISVVAAALRGRGFAPGPFVSGAFVILGIGFLGMRQLLGVAP